MSIFTLITLAFAMSMDSFVVALSQGTTLKRPTYQQAMKIGLLFGVVEGLTPLIGWVIGRITSQWIQEFDHWIAFILLTGLGLKILHEALSKSTNYEQNTQENADNLNHETQNEAQSYTRKSIWVLIITAIGTSIDAMAVGVSLAFLTVNIWLASLMIGIATTIMASSGIILGHLLGTKIGRSAEIFGGTVLIVIGTSILAEHMHWF